MAGYSLLGAVTIGLIYLALEPYVRRRWPSLIISWNRLLVGDWRDPLVGRDILVGGMLGLGHTAAIYLAALLPIWTGGRAVPNSGLNISYLEGVRHLWATFLMNLPFAVFVRFLLFAASDFAGDNFQKTMAGNRRVLDIAVLGCRLGVWERSALG